jgi:hypothetical protein
MAALLDEAKANNTINLEHDLRRPTDHIHDSPNTSETNRWVKILP